MRSVLGVGIFAAGLAGPAAAQVGGPREPDLVDLALAWARGDYRSPIICEFDGTPRRGLRRVLIASGPAERYRRSDEIRLFDLEPENATRCFDELRGDAPNLIGRVWITLESASRPDTARRDFRALLEREGGVSYRVERGRVQLREVGGKASTREVDFRGGTAHLTEIAATSDAGRLLAEFGPRPKRRLELAAPDGTRIVLDLVAWGRPGSPR